MTSNWDTTEAYALLCAHEELYLESIYYARHHPDSFESWVRDRFADGKQLDPDRVDYGELLVDFLMEED